MQCFSSLVLFFTAIVVGFMARRSPKKDWQYIKEWPAILLMLISMVVSQMEYQAEDTALRNARYNFTRDCAGGIWNTDAWKPCSEEAERAFPDPPPLKPPLDRIRSGFWSILLDAPFDLGGIWLGGLFAGRKKSIPKTA